MLLSVPGSLSISMEKALWADHPGRMTISCTKGAMSGVSNHAPASGGASMFQATEATVCGRRWASVWSSVKGCESSAVSPQMCTFTGMPVWYLYLKESQAAVMFAP